MPIFEYACPSCGRSFEELCFNGGDQEKPCPSCGASSHRVISNTSFILKGGGWFASSYGHGTSNLFDKTHGVPTVHDGNAQHSEKAKQAESTPSAPANAKDKAAPAGTKEKQ